MTSLTASIVVGVDTAMAVDCIESLLAAAGPVSELRVRVICNDVRDFGLAPAIAQRFPSVEISENATSLGFAANHNRALVDAQSDYLLIANDDLVFGPESVARCIAFLEEPGNADVGSLSPRLLNADGTLQRSTYAFPTVPRALLDLAGLRPWLPHNRLTDAVARAFGRGSGRSRFWAHDSTCDVDTFRGAAMFVRRTAWEAVGPMSEATRAGGEVGEWHRRCWDAGWRVVFFHEAEVVHYVSQTAKWDPLVPSEHLKGYLQFFQRHAPPRSAGIFRRLGVAIAGTRLTAARMRRDARAIEVWTAKLRVLRRHTVDSD